MMNHASQHTVQPLKCTMVTSHSYQLNTIVNTVTILRNCHFSLIYTTALDTKYQTKWNLQTNDDEAFLKTDFW